MPVDYSLINPQYQRTSVNLAGGFASGEQQNRINKLGAILAGSSLDPAMAQYAQIDPIQALIMREKEAGLSGKKSVFERKLEAGQTDTVRGIAEKWTSVLEQAVKARQQDPKANIAPFIQQAAQLEAQYAIEAGRPMKSTMSSKLVNQLASDRGILEKDEDETYQASQNVVDKVLEETNAELKDYRVAVPSLEKALGLMAAGVENPDSLNPTAIASAIKMYVRSLDNSVVNAGEVNQISGGNILDTVLAMVNGLTKGVKYSEDQLRGFYRSMVRVAEIANSLLERNKASVLKQASTLLDLASQSGRVAEGAKEGYFAKINELVETKMAPFFVDIPGTEPAFQEVELIKASGGGGGGGKNPLADVDF